MRTLISFAVVTFTTGRVMGAAFASYHKLAILLVIVTLVVWSIAQATCSIYSLNIAKRILGRITGLVHLVIDRLPSLPRANAQVMLGSLASRLTTKQADVKKGASGLKIAGVAALLGMWWATAYAQAGEVHPAVSIPMMGIGNTIGFFIAFLVGWQICVGIAAVMVCWKKRERIASLFAKFATNLRPIEAR